MLFPVERPLTLKTLYPAHEAMELTFHLVKES